MRMVRACRSAPRIWRRLLVIAAVLAASCAMPPTNPFLGAWATPERNAITFRDATLVVAPTSGEAPTEMNPQACGGRFHFSYSRKSRDALTELVARQPDLRAQLDNLLRQPEYPVAELGCDQGDNTYVLLDDRDLVVIYRDGEIAAVERLSRI